MEKKLQLKLMGSFFLFLACFVRVGSKIIKNWFEMFWIPSWVVAFAVVCLALSLSELHWIHFRTLHLFLLHPPFQFLSHGVATDVRDLVKRSQRKCVSLATYQSCFAAVTQPKKLNMSDQRRVNTASKKMPQGSAQSNHELLEKLAPSKHPAWIPTCVARRAGNNFLFLPPFSLPPPPPICKSYLCTLPGSETSIKTSLLPLECQRTLGTNRRASGSLQETLLCRGKRFVNSWCLLSFLCLCLFPFGEIQSCRQRCSLFLAPTPTVELLNVNVLPVCLPVLRGLEWFVLSRATPCLCPSSASSHSALVLS